MATMNNPIERIIGVLILINFCKGEGHLNGWGGLKMHNKHVFETYDSDLHVGTKKW